MNPLQLRTYIIKPTLEHLGLYSKEAETLILATACAESLCGKYIHQEGGPALGIYQMEPATAKDIIMNFLRFRPELYKKIQELMIPSLSVEENLICNLRFATAMCRMQYLRDKQPLPKTAEEMAATWKRVYNTSFGKGTVEGFLRKWKEIEG
mgnify:CR=1 FL=1|jgi:hypothetical protein